MFVFNCAEPISAEALSKGRSWHSGSVIIAAGLAQALTPAFVSLVGPGSERAVSGIELVEPGDGSVPDRGDLVLVVGARSVDEVLTLVGEIQGCAGLVLRSPWADDSSVQQACAEGELPLLAVTADVSWSALVALLRSALGRGEDASSGHVDHVYTDLFDMADTIGSILDAPVTIEDATSRVLAYSTGQDGVDAARMSTIVGRQVPRAVRDHFRSLGVFRRLAVSDAPIFVPAGEDGVRARYVVPIRVGSEWLGSVWALRDEPLPASRDRELRAATEVLALYLLRMRSQTELYRQVHLDHIRTSLHGGFSTRPSWLDPGPWRVAALTGPIDTAGAEARGQLWQALARRRGWRQPLIVDIDETVYAIVRADGKGVGGWSWFTDFVREENRRQQSIGVIAGERVETVAGLKDSRGTADEMLRLSPTALTMPIASIETAWSAVVLERAVARLRSQSLVSPIATLLDDESGSGSDLVATLKAVIDYWCEPRRAARALGVHPNTVRYRLARLNERTPLDLTDPAARLALRLEIERAQSTD